jgi:mycofactocin glycosyltransferase
MKGFAFSLQKNVSLEERADGFFLVSRQPVKLLRVNRSLYLLLKHVGSGGEISAFSAPGPQTDAGRRLFVLLSLVSRGYLKLDRISEIEAYPAVSIVIPVKNQFGDLGECLHSLSEINYPSDRLEIIVVDDGSRKKVSDMISSSGVTIIREDESRGPASSRNIGAELAKGELLAFLDADCVAGAEWLRELVPFFQAYGIGAVGGFVGGYHERGLLDRYEAVASPLNMGRRILLEGKTPSTFYVPTVNLLVKREIFMATGGFKSGMRTGEDVDFCWRLREEGKSLLYVPFGSVAHKHRKYINAMLLRRGQYGTSEAALYHRHKDKRKTFLFQLLPALSFLALLLAVLLYSPYPLIAIPLLFLLDIWHKSTVSKNNGISLNFSEIAASALRSTVSFYYLAFFHPMRYYLIVIIGLGFLWHPVWLFGGLAVIYTSVLDYFTKKPRMLYPFFLFIYLAEHLAYQIGVFWGCVQQRFYGSYRLSFRHSRL